MGTAGCSAILRAGSAGGACTAPGSACCACPALSAGTPLPPARYNAKLVARKEALQQVGRPQLSPLTPPRSCALGCMRRPGTLPSRLRLLPLPPPAAGAAGPRAQRGARAGAAAVERRRHVHLVSAPVVGSYARATCRALALAACGAGATHWPPQRTARPAASPPLPSFCHRGYKDTEAPAAACDTIELMTFARSVANAHFWVAMQQGWEPPRCAWGAGEGWSAWSSRCTGGGTLHSKRPLPNLAPPPALAAACQRTGASLRFGSTRRARRCRAGWRRRPAWRWGGGIGSRGGCRRVGAGSRYQTRLMRGARRRWQSNPACCQGPACVQPTHAGHPAAPTRAGLAAAKAGGNVGGAAGGRGGSGRGAGAAALRGIRRRHARLHLYQYQL